MVVDTVLDTFPKYLFHNSETFPDRAAIREKEFGIWQSWTWSEFLDCVRNFSVGLSGLGLSSGDRVAIIGNNRPRLYWTMIAAQCLGALPVPVYQESVGDEIGWILAHAGVRFVVAEDQEQVDKVLSIRDMCPSLSVVIYDDDRGMKHYSVEGLHSFDSVLSLGRRMLDEDTDCADVWRRDALSVCSSSDCVILYTSGTTGQPKGVVLTYENVVTSARYANAFDSLDWREDVLAYLPMAWVGDYIFSYGQAFVAGYCVNCPENQETVTQDRREIGPTYFFAPPRVYESLLTSIMVRMEDAGFVKRWLFDYAMSHARVCGESLLDGSPVSILSRLVYGFYDILVYAPLRNRLGFSRLKVAYTAGEAIGPEIFRFYRSLGINLKQLYGQTEASVYVTMQPDGKIDAETVGVPAPGVEVKIEDGSGEILYRSSGVFREYFRNEEATLQTKTEDGWVRSGDAGVFDSRGQLKIIDRAKDVGHLNDGSLFPPKYIENKLKFYPNIKEAVAFGDGRDYCAVFLNIDLTAVGSWAERHNIAYASYQELASDGRVYSMLRGHIEEVNRRLAEEPDLSSSQIRRFLVLHKELDADDGEITRTNKVRRSRIMDRYGSLIDALYAPDLGVCTIETEVVFEDGRKGILRGDIEISTAETYPAVAMRKDAA